MIFHLLWSFYEGINLEHPNTSVMIQWLAGVLLGKQNKTNISTSFISRGHLGSDATNTRSFPTTSHSCRFVPPKKNRKTNKATDGTTMYIKKLVNPGIWRWLIQGQNLHPGRLTAGNLQITHDLERKMIFESNLHEDMCKMLIFKGVQPFIRSFFFWVKLGICCSALQGLFVTSGSSRPLSSGSSCHGKIIRLSGIDEVEVIPYCRDL